MDLEEAIQNGYTKLMPNQGIVIEQYMKGKDLLFCSPTGSGKSFQYLEKKQPCTCIVISPLAGLMELQVSGFLLELPLGSSNEDPQFIFSTVIKQRLQISHKKDILQLYKLFVA